MARRARIGQLTERITIQSRTTTVDSQLGQTDTWSTFASNVPAAVRPWPRAGGEFLYAGAKNSQVDYEIEIRYRGDVTPQMRVLWTPYRGAARTLEIFEVHPLNGRRDRLLLECVEMR